MMFLTAYRTRSETGILHNARDIKKIPVGVINVSESKLERSRPRATPGRERAIMTAM